MAAFTNQRDRLRRTLENALSGAAYDSARDEEPRMIVLTAQRPDGRRIGVRFRGVSSSVMSASPEPGAALSLRGVSTGGFSLFSVLRFLGPGWNMMRPPAVGSAHVRIEAGAARLDIVCQDAEWWEEDAAPGEP